MKFKKLKSLLVIVIAVGFLVNNINEQKIAFSYVNNCYPTNGWLRADPEDLGMNSTELDRMYQAIISQNVGIDSIQIVRYGYLCYEEYFEYYNSTNIHNTHSITKSVISALIGIANATGMITNLDEPVVEIFSNRTIQNQDARKEAMTIRHLLEMRSGLDVNDLSVSYTTTSIPFNDFTFRTNTSNVMPGTWVKYLNPVNDFTRLITSDDWIQFALDKPMESDPGTKFAYSDCITHLLSAIIREKTGMNTENFAKQYLFDPLNITEYLWWEDPSGLSMGADGLWLTPHDMLKIGYLYLNLGKWNDAQIIPSDWVIKSTQDYSPESGFDYGYQWWLDSSNDYYYADGWGGQHIIIKPDKDLVVVFTAWDPTSIMLFNAFILDAVVADVSVTCPTTTPTTTSTTTTPPTDSTTTTKHTSETTTTSATGFDILLVFGIVTVNLTLAFRRKKK